MEEQSIFDVETQEITRSIFISPYFHLHKIADGVFAAIARTEDGGDRSNTGLIVLGEYAIAFDTFILPQSTEDLLRFSHEDLGKNIKVLVSSHHHSDHIWGDAPFDDDITIISTEISRTIRMERTKSEMNDIRKKLPSTLSTLRKQKATATSTLDQTQIEGQIRFYQALSDALSDISPRPPTLTFEYSMDIHGQKRSAKLISFSHAHTPSDTILYLPDDRIVFAGDLLFKDRHPYMMECDPAGWIDAIDAVLTLDFDVVVPGHGGLASREDLLVQRDYLLSIINAVEQVINSGGTAKQAADTKPPSEFAHYTSGSFVDNMRYTFEFMNRLD